jgi:lipopolysaccharide transport system permease protein
MFIRRERFTGSNYSRRFEALNVGGSRNDKENPMLTREFEASGSADRLPLAGAEWEAGIEEGDASEEPHLTIEAGRAWAPLNLRELWQFRDLLVTLAGRDLRLRYKQTALGVVWVILQPMLAASVFAFVFGIVAKLPSGKVPYLVFSYAGLLGWNLFSGVLTKITGSLVGNAHLISKVFFPRLILPLSSIGSVLVDFSVAAAMMVILMVVFRITPSPLLLLLPVGMVILTGVALGTGLAASALAVSYRDVQYIIPVFTQILLYASPVAYSVSAVPGRYRWLYMLNPLTPPLEAMRSSLLGTPFPGWPSLGISAALAMLLLSAGLYSFKRMERKFADVI